MANLNKTNCNCNGVWNVSTESCDPVIEGTDPCPSVWKSLASWNWGEISHAGLEWGYGLGLLNRPDQTDTAMYMFELERQKRQTMYIMMGLLALAIVVAIVLVRGRGRKK